MIRVGDGAWRRLPIVRLMAAALAAFGAMMAIATPAFAENSITIWRLSNPYTGERFFTEDLSEYSRLGSNGWTREGEGWKAPTSGTAVYRLYNPWSGDHHYTTSKSEYDQLGDQGWNKEKVAFYSASDTAQPVYRLYNPYAKAGTHHYTTSISEYAELGTKGWRQERAGWYGVGSPSDLPSGWIKVTGTLLKTNYYQWYVDSGGNEAWRLDQLRRDPTPLTVLQFDEPVGIDAWYEPAAKVNHVIADSIHLNNDLFADYKAGQHLTLVVDQSQNAWSSFKFLGIGAYRVAIL